MSLAVRIDEQIQVGTTPGLVAGTSTFTFDGTGGKPDYRFFQPVFTLIGGSILIQGVDYSWVPNTGVFTLLKFGVMFISTQYYNVHFQPVIPPATGLVTSLIDTTFFILNINLVNTSQNAVYQKINAAIAKYETKCLKGILGYQMYSVLVSENSQRITDLIYGRDYIDENKNLQHWDGLVFGQDTQNQSLIADYIYYMFQDMSATFTTGVSTSVTNTESGQSVSPQDKMIDSWNSFSRRTKEMLYFLWNMNYTSQSNPAVFPVVPVYPEFKDCQFEETKSFSKHNNIFGF